jgi:hypothetical protein
MGVCFRLGRRDGGVCARFEAAAEESFVLFKSVSADERAKQLADNFKTDADARKLAREKQKAADISLAFEQNGSGNTTWLTVKAQEDFPSSKWRARGSSCTSRMRRRACSSANSRPCSSDAGGGGRGRGARGAAGAQAQVAALRLRPGSEARAHQLALPAPGPRATGARHGRAEGGGLDSCTSALKTLQADEVLNPDGLFNSLTSGTPRGWVQDLDEHDGDVGDFLKPKTVLRTAACGPDSKTIHTVCAFSS